MKRWLLWKQVDVILTRAVLAAVLLTEWTPPSPMWFGACMAVGVVMGAIVLLQIATDSALGDRTAREARRAG